MSDDLSTFATAYDDAMGLSDGSLRINWYNGAPMMRTPGAFFVSTRRLEGLGIDGLGAPWRKVDRVFASGDAEEGWETQALKVAPIGIRTQDVVIKPDGGLEFLSGRVSKEGRPAGWSIYTELLCMIEGFDGPVKWSAKRIKTSMAIINGFRLYRKEVLDEARRARKNPRIPSWAFWVLIKSEVDGKGKPVYQDTTEGGPKVTPPQWGWPSGTTEDRVSAMYVGKRLLHKGEELRSEFNAFFTTSIGGDPVGGGAVAAVAAPELDSF
jgi:hypothetical protein